VPQLDIFSYLSTVIYLILLFLTIVFVMHTYYLPKISAALKIRAKLQQVPVKESVVKSSTKEDPVDLTAFITTIITTLKNHK
jgi:hypothetical protein